MGGSDAGLQEAVDDRLQEGDVEHRVNVKQLRKAEADSTGVHDLVMVKIPINLGDIRLQVEVTG